MLFLFPFNTSFPILHNTNNFQAVSLSWLWDKHKLSQDQVFCKIFAHNVQRRSNRWHCDGQDLLTKELIHNFILSKGSWKKKMTLHIPLTRLTNKYFNTTQWLSKSDLSRPNATLLPWEKYKYYHFIHDNQLHLHFHFCDYFQFVYSACQS